jgi:hypothetical protein
VPHCFGDCKSAPSDLVAAHLFARIAQALTQLFARFAQAWTQLIRPFASVNVLYWFYLTVGLAPRTSQSPEKSQKKQQLPIDPLFSRL